MHVHIDLTLAFSTPLATSGESLTFGVPGVSRDAAHNLLLPGSSLKGALRHSAEQLVRALEKPCCQAPRPERMCRDAQALCAVCRVFGSPAARSPLAFLDLSCGEPGVPSQLRQGVAIDRRRRAAQDQLLYSREAAPALPGLTFVAAPAISGYTDAPGLALLVGAIRLRRSWGGGRSRGTGWAEAHGACSIDGGSPTPLGAIPLEPLREL